MYHVKYLPLLTPSLTTALRFISDAFKARVCAFTNQAQIKKTHTRKLSAKADFLNQARKIPPRSTSQYFRYNSGNAESEVGGGKKRA